MKLLELEFFKAKTNSFQTGYAKNLTPYVIKKWRKFNSRDYFTFKIHSYGEVIQEDQFIAVYANLTSTVTPLSEEYLHSPPIV